MNKTLIILAVLFLMVLPVHAQDNTDSTGDTPTPKPAKHATKKDSMAKDTTSKTKGKDSMTQTESEADFEQKVESQRTETAQKIKKEYKRVHEDIQAIKDEDKRKVVDKLFSDINDLNDRINQYFVRQVATLQKSLDQLNQLATQASQNNIDISAVTATIDKAKTALASSHKAVESQVASVYTIHISTAKKLPQDIGKTRKALYTDLVSVEKFISGAQSALKDVSRSFKQALNTPATSTSPVMSATPQATSDSSSNN